MRTRRREESKGSRQEEPESVELVGSLRVLFRALRAFAYAFSRRTEVRGRTMLFESAFAIFSRGVQKKRPLPGEGQAGVKKIARSIRKCRVRTVSSTLIENVGESQVNHPVFRPGDTRSLHRLLPVFGSGFAQTTRTRRHAPGRRLTPRVAYRLNQMWFPNLVHRRTSVLLNYIVAFGVGQTGKPDYKVHPERKRTRCSRRILPEGDALTFLARSFGYGGYTFAQDGN